MTMLPIVWSEKARREYARNIEELSKNSLNAALELDERTEKMILQISAFPFSFQASLEIPGCRRCVITKRYSLVYEVREKFVYLVSFFDNRSGAFRF